nr:hypothetical protein HUO10_005372 [Paraburkholderia busanensis]
MTGSSLRGNGIGDAAGPAVHKDAAARVIRISNQLVRKRYANFLTSGARPVVSVARLQANPSTRIVAAFPAGNGRPRRQALNEARNTVNQAVIQPHRLFKVHRRLSQSVDAGCLGVHKLDTLADTGCAFSVAVGPNEARAREAFQLSWAWEAGGGGPCTTGAGDTVAHPRSSTRSRICPAATGLRNVSCASPVTGSSAPDMSTTGTCRNLSIALRILTASGPSRKGMLTSEMMTSGRVSTAARRAARPSCAPVTTCPCSTSTASSASLSAASSSTIRTLRMMGSTEFPSPRNRRSRKWRYRAGAETGNGRGSTLMMLRS